MSVITLYTRQVDALLVQAVREGLTGGPLADAQIISAYQTEQQGRPSGPTILFHRLFERYAGSTELRERRTDDGEVVQDEINVVEATYQWMAITKERAAIDALTAMDILRTVAFIMRGPRFLASLFDGGALVMRVGELRNNWAKNDQDQYEPNPSFDAIITYKTVSGSTIPVIDNIGHKIIGI